MTNAVEVVGVEPAASSLLSSWWSRDNLVTSHPGRLYDGRVLERIEADSLEYLMAELAEQRGSLRAGEGRMGVFTWDFACEDDAGAFVVQLPVALDEPGRRGRAKRDVPRQNFENAKHYLARGLPRFVPEPDGIWALAGGVTAATFRARSGYCPASFGTGAVRVTLADGWTLALGPRATAEILAEIIAAVVYHYEPELEGGTALSDVFVNDDFVVKRRRDGSFELGLTAARRREPGIGPNLLLLYLVQLMTYEDFALGDRLSGQPTLLSNPSVTFEGVARGLRYRYQDTGGAAEDGEREARRWIADFGRSREGRAYRPWVERFLDGGLPLRFGDDPRERWWRLFAQQSRLSLLELRARAEPASGAAESARELKSLLERLSRELGRAPEAEPGQQRLNDASRDELLALLAEVNVDAGSREGVADALFAHWPYRALDALLARVPGARGLRRAKSRLSFGRAVSPAEQGTRQALGPAPKSRVARVVANPELFSPFSIPPALHALAVSTFPSFEAYMDAALHDETWGYYAHRVVIADGGHFLTHPEELSPHYGRWLAARAYDAWRELVSHAELSEDETFSLIEFGAGNGRLARDVLDAVDAGAPRNTREPERWPAFAARLSYRIYELSESLREKQRALLGERATVVAGDARRPGAALQRDFPDGVRGLVVSNELPDAFGVHKVVMAANGADALAALVVPRIEPALRVRLGAALSERTAAADAAIRRAFAFQAHPEDHYLDARAFTDVMRAVAEQSGEREEWLSGLWFEEAYVPVSVIPALAAQLERNGAEYRAALAEEPSGVVLYVNLHAGVYMRELARALAAGFVVTIDYGDSTAGLVRGARHGDFLFRVYGESRDYVPRPNDPYFAPGTQDLTADVNFTDLARAGQECGLELVHFGPERDIAGAELADALRASSSSPPFERFLGNPPFKLLVLGTRASGAFASPLMTPLALSLRAG